MTETPTETQPCRICGTDVTITRVDGQIQQTDSSGDVICDVCWAADVHGEFLANQ